MFVIFKCFWTTDKIAGKEEKSHLKTWTKKEVGKFAEVLADPVNEFAFCLDRLALKKLSKKWSLPTYKEKLWWRISEKSIDRNHQKNNFGYKCKVKNYKKFDKSITRHRNKSLKSGWCKLHSLIKRASGLAPSYDPLMTQAYAWIRLSSSAHETSFVQEDGESDYSDSNKVGSHENTTQTYEKTEVVDIEDEIVPMTNTKTLLNGLNINLTWT